LGFSRHGNKLKTRAGGALHEILLRTVVGGVVVSCFSILGDLLKPKSFAGLFGAAPSVALASLYLAVKQHGTQYASLEGRWMIVGAVAFLIYASVVSRLMVRRKWAALPATGAALLLWLGIALGLYGLMS
jgi:hypothetical protein